MNEIDKNIDNYLASQNIKFEIRFIADMSTDKEWSHDLWQYTFSQFGKAGLFTDQFKTGTGLRQLDKKAYKPSGFEYLHPSRKKLWVSENSKPVSPTAASVLYCTILDASALDTSFEYWCADYGYDTDSIRHFNIYQQCCNIGKQMKQVFTNKQIETLREMLQDY